MRNALGVSRTAVLLVAGVVAGCATASPRGSASDDLPGLSLLPAPEQRQVMDSLQAEQIAEADGPRVRVSANFENISGSRQVDAIVRADDDAYIVVGQIDATGRLSIVYPKHPGDDGFVQGGHSYRIPPFFGGFTDEFRYRRATDYTRLSMIRSRNDSYDAGTGYVFVVASWRPMQVDRVADGSRWSSYEISSDEYLNDPRAAVEELAQVLAGDTGEAYTVEYAHYMSTNYGMYSANSFDRCSFAGYDDYGFGGFGMGLTPWRRGFGFGSSWYGFSGASGLYGMPVFVLASPFVSYIRDYDALTGCSYYTPVYQPPIIVSSWPLMPQSPMQPNGFRPLTPEMPRPPKFGDGPVLAGPVTTPSASRRPSLADLTATDINGMHPAQATTHPSIEQMVRRHRPGIETMTRPGVEAFPAASVQGERPRYTPHSAEPRLEPSSTRPRFEPRPEMRPATETPHASPPPRMAPPARFTPPPMHVEPVREAPPPSSGSSSSGHGGKSKP